MLKIPLIVVLALVCVSDHVWSQPRGGALASTPSVPRLRPYDGRVAQVLLDGIQRSSTFRAITDALEQRDVIVYFEMQPALGRGLAGTMIFLAATPSYRYVRVSLNPMLPNEILIATLAHELQHALEVALDPSIVDEPTLEAYYRRHGIHMRAHDNGWDSEAARQAGTDVRDELAKAQVETRTERFAEFRAAEWPTVYRRARSMLPP